MMFSAAALSICCGFVITDVALKWDGGHLSRPSDFPPASPAPRPVLPRLTAISFPLFAFVEGSRASDPHGRVILSSICGKHNPPAIGSHHWWRIRLKTIPAGVGLANAVVPNVLLADSNKASIWVRPPAAPQKPTLSPPFSAKISRASCGVAMEWPSSTRIRRIFATCSALSAASLPRPM
jgi:hypothetical protein